MKLAGEILAGLFLLAVIIILVVGVVRARPYDEYDSCQYNYPGDDDE